MSYSATVYKVLIYLSSDLSEERNDILEAIRLWNEKNSEAIDAVLVPVVWQDSNKDDKNYFLDVFQSNYTKNFDIFLNFFWTRVDGSSDLDITKIINEIDSLSSFNKSVLLFFYTMPVFSQSIDHADYQQLIELKLNFDKKGITDNFESATELEQKVEFRLSRIIDKFKGMEVADSSVPTGTTPEFEPKYHDKQNVIKNVSSYITNLRKNFQESEIKKEGEVTLNKLFNKGDDLIKSLKDAVVIPVPKEGNDSNKVEAVDLVDEEKTESVNKDLKQSEEPPKDIEKKKSPAVKTKTDKKPAKSKQRNKKVEKAPPTSSKTSKKEDVKSLSDEIESSKKDTKKDYQDDIQQKPETNIKLPQLGEIKEEILKILGEAEKIGIESIGEAEILNATNLSEMDVSYNLVALTDDKFIKSIYDKNKPPQYKISETGMDYLTNKDLL